VILPFFFSNPHRSKGGGERVALRKKIVSTCNFFALSILIEIRKEVKGLILASSKKSPFAVFPA